MRLPNDLRPAKLSERLTGFSAAVEVDGRREVAHVANFGRLRELLSPGRTVYVAPVDSPGRKTRYDLKLVRMPGVLVSADARLPNPLVQEAVLEGRFSELQGYASIRREVTYGESRLDIELTGASGRCLVEVKSVTLIEKGFALFPDAPTERGRRHLRTLMQVRRDGLRAAVVFVVQRPEVQRFRPHDAADPAFGETLRDARAGGVEIYARRCRVSLDEIAITDSVPVVL